MSNLSMLPIHELRTIFNLDVLIETGTEYGYGIDTGLKASFKEVYSCEILENRYKKAQDKYKANDRVFLFNGASKDMLEVMLDMNSKQSALFWLDAHLPNCHNPAGEYTIEDILPLIDELKIIAGHERNSKNDVIVIDDLCLVDEQFRNKDFDLQRWTHNKGSRDIAISNIKLVFNYHIWFKDIRAEGCLIGLPDKGEGVAFFDRLCKQYNLVRI